ncbi:aminotransferase class I/II-fold pyridoxal phosphate-dependent enzyme [Aestuariicella hydrocarbonica]|uniref:Aminotransferase class I/II-fold pyridoxal phosphate-dependent enzyme n=1 Tax=Pseudomaricurvus hydrocarbonicus TaxID=1470433 RepID=A0A9E5MIV1_9GAMM|nr:aminotransferase class I/II-fold pyridoxal phosphate-dependent enzyme [Aestuariicella hydrocarbonica]NHO64074.1 aminotransferase class I/II-fold pyridoxal phosphate-dependent enzyme [Aestuariicella hydrocarbonica]
MNLDQATPEQLQQWEAELANQYQSLQDQSLNLDLTRGKPSAEQLNLSDALDGILDGDYRAADGTDVRNYGGLDGIQEAKQFAADVLQVNTSEVLVGGNSSLTLMFQTVLFAHEFGLQGADSAWKTQGKVKFLCPVPGYDRHFTVCEQLGIDMVTVPMLSTGPDMDQVEAMIKADPQIVGMWCVPKYSNPTGVVYSDETVERIAQLANIANPYFRVFWDNAYAVHDLVENPPELANIMDACRKHNTEDSVLQFASTSKITHAGSGVCFMAASPANLAGFQQVLASCTIGPDKVNQLRHARLLPDMTALRAHMKKHAAIIQPRFNSVLENLSSAFDGTGLGTWETPVGGYFISFDTLPGCAQAVVKLAADAGVKLTPAGATFPYGKDPQDRNIRLAPTVPTVEEVDQAMKVFEVCVKLASVRSKLAA